MHEQSKSAKRRFYDGNFAAKYFVGNGLDIGCGPDSIGQYLHNFPLMTSVTPWDMPQGDAQYLESIPNEMFDFVHSSHCLEHMVDIDTALNNWIRVLKPGGHLIITVPDEDMYEHGVWPSQNNIDHKWSFTVCKFKSLMPASVNVVDLVADFASVLECVKVQKIDDFYRADIDSKFDQTMTPNAECSIEIIWKKR
jgi:SAM-dependent methyltransferase